MAHKNFIIKAPGKLIISGEWAVLNHSTAIVAAINRFITIEIERTEIISISSEHIHLKKLEIEFEYPQVKLKKKVKKQIQEKIDLLLKTIETSLQYLYEKKIKIKHFSIKIRSEISKIKIDNKYHKIGLGSSAASVVGITSAILKLHGLQVETKRGVRSIFKLSSISHFSAQGFTGSCADIAASTYKNTLSYKKFDSNWLKKKLTNTTISKIVETKWPELEIKKIRLPENLIMLAGFVGYSSSTKGMMNKCGCLKKNSVLKKIGLVCKKLENELAKTESSTSKKNILALLTQNRILLKKFNPKLETEELTKLIDIANKYNASGKFSGAGGGDCGIAICFDKKTKNKIQNDWIKNAIHPIDIEILTNSCL